MCASQNKDENSQMMENDGKCNCEDVSEKDDRGRNGKDEAKNAERSRKYRKLKT